MLAKLLVRALLALQFFAFATAVHAGQGTDATMQTSELTAPVAVPTQTINQLLEAIREREREGGPYDSQLGEQLSSLGLAYQRNGEHAQAVQTLNRTLQIKRVNEGLQSMGQLSTLESIIENNIAVKDWEELDRNYQLLLWLHRRNFESDDQRLLPIIDKMGRWKLQAYRDKLLEQNPDVTLREAEDLYRQTIKLLEKQYGKTDARLIDPLYGNASTEYEIMRETMKKPLDSFRSASRAPLFNTISYQQVCARTRQGVICRVIPVVTGGGNLGALASEQNSKDMQIHYSLQKAKRSLSQIVDIFEANPNLPRRSYGLALVHLGDWYMFHRQPGAANDHYKKAYAALVESGTSKEDIDNLFGKPAGVPSLQLPLPDVEKKLSEERQYVEVAFDVSKTGRVTNIEVMADPDDSSGIRRKVRKMLTESRFRPRLENGEPVDTVGLKIRVPVPA
ncbi:MAG: hypothetical protein HYY48_10620 [Gammaproteobacteria bacterium]|nr:hypothetical protein [Gammaproteobacteria bacterium]